MVRRGGGAGESSKRGGGTKGIGDVEVNGGREFEEVGRLDEEEGELRRFDQGSKETVECETDDETTKVTKELSMEGSSTGAMIADSTSIESCADGGNNWNPEVDVKDSRYGIALASTSLSTQPLNDGAAGEEEPNQSLLFVARLLQGLWLEAALWFSGCDASVFLNNSALIESEYGVRGAYEGVLLFC
ncbi:hypothetical protein ACSQ67_019972 [Phaseolus vulgaris]